MFWVLNHRSELQYYASKISAILHNLQYGVQRCMDMVGVRFIVRRALHIPGKFPRQYGA